MPPKYWVYVRVLGVCAEFGVEAPLLDVAADLVSEGGPAFDGAVDAEFGTAPHHRSKAAQTTTQEWVNSRAGPRTSQMPWSGRPSPCGMKSRTSTRPVGVVQTWARIKMPST
ncbi:hypothetical protein RCH22_000584 [Cryobacterium psychrotolerans]|nr:hypothetical protein [Cryobacterium psychrotolerans]